MRAFSSEWVKLSRPATLFGFGGTMIGFALLFTIMAFESAGGRNIDLDGSGSESFVTAAMLSLPEGSILVVTDMAVFLGIVALALFASNLAGEFSKGTIRMLFWNKATPGPRWSPRWREAARIVRSLPAPVFLEGKAGTGVGGNHALRSKRRASCPRPRLHHPGRNPLGRNLLAASRSRPCLRRVAQTQPRREASDIRRKPRPRNHRSGQ